MYRSRKYLIPPAGIGLEPDTDQTKNGRLPITLQKISDSFYYALLLHET